MPETDLALLIDAARAAGEVALSFAEGQAQVWQKPDGQGPVTEADIAVNQVLKERLLTARPDYGWLSEENEDDGARLQASRVFIVDPIDGTRSFIEGAPSWAHALAVVDQGEVTAAVVYLPKFDALYSAAKGQGASLNQQGVKAGMRDILDGATLLAAKPALQAKHWHSAVPQVERVYRPSLAYRQALVAEGRFDAMLTLRRTWEWDIAAGDLILSEAGAVSSDRLGQPLRYNNPVPKLNGIVAANPDLHRVIIQELNG